MSIPQKLRRNILNEYYTKKAIFELLEHSVMQLIGSLLKSKRINLHQITSRTKGYDSLSNKIKRKNKYRSINDITDIVGIRIITYLEDEIDKIAEIITKEFKVDEENSVDKREVEADKFGYRSLHYVVEINPERLALSEYSSFKKIKFEIQIRSILQHSWAEIEHDMGYKGESEIPDNSKRTFYRVAALLEQADIEFVKLKKEITIYEKTVPQQIKDSPSKTLINKASIMAYARNSPKIKAFDDQMRNSRKDIVISPIRDDMNFFSANIINGLKAKGVETIADLDKLVDKNGSQITQKKIKEWPATGRVSFIQGLSLILVITANT